MLGHKDRFTNSFIKELEFFLSKSINDVSYSELNQALNLIKREKDSDKVEKRYLKAKLSIILADIAFLDDNKRTYTLEVKKRDLGFQIFRIYGLLIQNETDSASKLLNNMKSNLPNNDFLLFGDYLLTSFFFHYIRADYQEIIQKFEIFQYYLDLLPDEASFTKLGIIYFAILTSFVTGNIEKTKIYLDKVLASNLLNQDLFFYSKLLNIAGRLELQSENFKDAKNYFSLSLAISRAINDKIGEISRLQSIASLETQLGNYHTSLEYYRKAKTLATAIDDQINLSYAHFSSGNILMRIGRLSEAENELICAVDLFFKGKNQRGLLESYTGLGIIAYNIGKNELAIKYYNKSFNLAKKLNLKISQASALNNIGLIYSDSGNYSKSIDYFNKSIKLFNITKEKFEVFRVSLNLADVFRRIGNIEQSTSLLNKSVNIVENDQEVNERQAHFFDKSAHLYFDLGNIKAAEEAAENSLAIYSRLGENLSATVAIQILGRIYFIKNNTKKALNIMLGAINTLEISNSFGITYQSIITDIIEFHLSNEQYKEANHFINILSKIDNKPNLQISEVIKEKINFYRLEMKYKEGKLVYDILKKFEVKIRDKKYFFLYLKTILLKIRLNLEKNDLSAAYNNLSFIEELVVEKQIIPMIIEISLLKSLLLAKEAKFDTALSTCQALNYLIEANNLLFYQKKQADILNLIENAQTSVSSLYNLAIDQENKYTEKTQVSQIPLEIILDYLDRTVRTIIDNPIS